MKRLPIKLEKLSPEDLRKQILSIAPNAMVMVAADRVLVSASATDQKSRSGPV
jgi:hypothetical protein